MAQSSDIIRSVSSRTRAYQDALETALHFVDYPQDGDETLRVFEFGDDSRMEFIVKSFNGACRVEFCKAFDENGHFCGER
jgi:hypothetical protein